VVEVLSPSTRRIDASAKLAGYFRIRDVQHYLIVDPDKRPVIHHARGKPTWWRRVSCMMAASLLIHPGSNSRLGIFLLPDRWRALY
jgi:hypothetical protein